MQFKYLAFAKYFLYVVPSASLGGTILSCYNCNNCNDTKIFNKQNIFQYNYRTWHLQKIALILPYYI